MSPNKRVKSDSLRRRFAPPPLAAHAQRYVIAQNYEVSGCGIMR